MHRQRLVFLAFATLLMSISHIRVYSSSLVLEDDQARQKIDATSAGLRFEGNKTAPDHFKLLERDGDSLLIGARDVVYNISIKDFSVQKMIFWPSRDEDVEMCLMKGKSKEDCHNFVRVLAKDNDTGILVCGTNAYRPLCRHFTLVNGVYNVAKEFPASGVAPYDPTHNSTAFFDAERNEIYAGTVADFAGTDALIAKRQIAQPDDDLGLRTERNDIKCLNEPNFVSSFADDDHVYFWFREGAVEYMNCGKAVYSRVGRVCKSDRGGPRANADTWTTFLKARLNCSIPGDYPFYFNEIEATSSVVTGQYGKATSSEVVYAVFNSPYSAIGGSAVCAFNMDVIRKTFGSSSFKSQSSANANWLPVQGSQVPQPRPGDCDSDSRQLSDEAVNFVKKNSLLDDLIPNFFSSPLVVQTGVRRFTHIAVDAQVSPVAADRKYDVVFVGTDDGKVLKLVNLADANQSKTVVIETVQLFKDRSTIKNMLVYRPLIVGKNKNVNDNEARLIVVGDEEIRSVPLHNCEKATTCAMCVRLQDPYCAWEMDSKSCIASSSGNWKSGKLVQNIANGFSKACPVDATTETTQAAYAKTESHEMIQSRPPFVEVDDNRNSSNLSDANAATTPCKCTTDGANKKTGHSRQITITDGASPDLQNVKDGYDITSEKISDPASNHSVYTAESLAVAVVVTMVVSMFLGIAVGLRLSKIRLLQWNKKKLDDKQTLSNKILYANGGCKIGAPSDGVANGCVSTIRPFSSQPINAYEYKAPSPTTIKVSTPVPTTPSSRSTSVESTRQSEDDDDVAVEVNLNDESSDSCNFSTLPKDYKVKKTYL